MKVYEIYFSPTGGTKKVADILTGEWECEKEEIDLFSTDEKKEFLSDDICLVAVPSYGGRVPETVIEKLKKFQGNNAKAVLVAVYGNRDFEDTLLELKDTLESRGFICPIAVSAVAEHSIFHQFAAGRPDEQDIKQLKEFSIRIKDYIHQGGISAANVPGSRPYRKYGGVPLKPLTGKECTGCGLCAKECPVGAILPESPRKTDKSKCISCMHCIEVCPAHTRKLNKLVTKIAYQKMKKVCKTRKENKIYL